MLLRKFRVTPLLLEEKELDVDFGLPSLNPFITDIQDVYEDDYEGRPFLISEEP